jgi:hypothetical protein
MARQKQIKGKYFYNSHSMTNRSIFTMINTCLIQYVQRQFLSYIKLKTSNSNSNSGNIHTRGKHKWFGQKRVNINSRKL